MNRDRYGEFEWANQLAKQPKPAPRQPAQLPKGHRPRKQRPRRRTGVLPGWLVVVGLVLVVVGMGIVGRLDVDSAQLTAEVWQDLNGL